MSGPAIPKGEVFEARVARLLTAEGAFVRRRVNLEAQFGQRFSTVTDVDVLAFRFDSDLRVHLSAVECKTTEAKSQPGIGDRLLWLSGLRLLVGADSAVLATTREGTPAARHIAAQLGCALLDIEDIRHREQILGLSGDGDYGGHDPRLLSLEARVFATAKSDDELKRIYWICRSGIWLAAPPIALKRAMSALRALGGRWSPRLPETERLAVEWLTAHAAVGLVLTLTRLASLAYQQPEPLFQQYLRERLSEGLADFATLREIAKAVDKYVVGVLTAAGVDQGVTVGAIGAFDPQPPPYLEPVGEVLERLGAQPAASGQLARQADALYASRFLPDLAPGSSHLPTREGAALLRLLAAFIERQAHVPGELLEPLRAAVANDHETSGRDRSKAEHQPGLPMLFPDA